MADRAPRMAGARDASAGSAGRAAAASIVHGEARRCVGARSRKRETWRKTTTGSSRPGVGGSRPDFSTARTDIDIVGRPDGRRSSRAPCRRPLRASSWTSSCSRVTLEMRPAGPSRGVLDPRDVPHEQEHRERDARGAGSGPSIPATLLVLIALAVALPALSFFAMHARVLDHQQTLTENTRGASRGDHNQISASFHRVERRCLFGRPTHCAALLTHAFPDSSPHPCFLCFLSDDDGGIDDCEKGSERDARDWFGSAGRTRGAVLARQALQDSRGAREGKGERNDAESLGTSARSRK